MKNGLIKLEIEDLKVLREWGTIATKSDIVPKNTTVEQCMAIIQTGKEVGIPPFQALRTMSFIKGKLCMEVKLQLALAREKGNVKVVKLVSDNNHCEITLKRDDEELTTTYDLKDAEQAGLLREGKCWGSTCKCGGDKDYHKSGWLKYPRQFLRWRAIGDNLRILCPDLVLGFISPEEAETLSNAEEIKTIPAVDLNRGITDFIGNLGNGEKEVKTDPTIGKKQLLTEAKTPPETKKIEYITPEEVKVLKVNLKSIGQDWEELCQDLDIESLAKLPTDRIVETTDWIKKHTKTTKKGVK